MGFFEFILFCFCSICTIIIVFIFLFLLNTGAFKLIKLREYRELSRSMFQQKKTPKTKSKVIKSKKRNPKPEKIEVEDAEFREVLK